MRAYLILLLSLAAIWGASFMFIEIALEDLEPTTLMAGRCVVALVFLLGVMIATGVLRRLREAGWSLFALGVINSALPFTLIAWGQKHIDSGVAAIGNASVPIWVAILAIWLAQSERATGLRIVGIVLGIVGVGVLTGAQPETDRWAVAGTLAVVAASVSYALASLLLQRQAERLDPLTLSTATMVGATATLLPFGVAQAPGELPGWEAAGAVLALGLAGTGAGILIFMKIISDYGSFRAGLVTYLLPVTALLYGAFLLDEQVTGWMIAGLLLILSGVALGSGLVRPARAPAPEPEAPEPAHP
jgi:drug/metabolite transporter (DMT)-like permease